MKVGIKSRIFSIILSVILFAASAIFIYIVYDSKFFDLKLLMIACVVILIMIVFAFILSFNTKKKIRTFFAILLSVILLFIESVGGYYIIVGKNTLEDIASSEPEYYELGVFVRIDDEANSLDDACDYTFGILDVLDRKSTDYATNEIVKKIGSDIDTQEYIDIAKLMNALVNTNEIEAIILNKNFLNILDEFENYSSDLLKIKEIYTVKITVEDDLNNITKPHDKYDDNVFTAYISGIDCNGNPSIRSRSDANVVATVNIKTGQILLVTIPRDYYIPLSISNGIPDKLTHAGIYGVDVSRDTLNMLFDIDIDYYFKVNFDGFEYIVDALGGITVYSDYEFSFLDDCYFKKGENHLNGKEALMFARVRKDLSGGARQRARNHMAVIKGVIDKITSPSMVVNYKSVLDSVSGACETDIPYKMITKLVNNQLKNGTQWNITMYSVDGPGDNKVTYSLGFSSYVTMPDYETVEKAKELMAAVRNGEIPQV